MRGLLHLMMILAMMVVTMHVSEPHAHQTAAEHSLEQSETGDVVERDAGSASDAADQAHHHCPVAESRGAAPIVPDVFRPVILYFPPISHELCSLAQAPPVEPPHA